MTDIRRPRADDRRIWEIVEGIVGYWAALVALDLGLFRVLAEAPRTLDETAEALGIGRRPAEALLSVCASLDLVLRDGGRHTLTPLAEDYLLDGSPTAFTHFLKFAMIANSSLSTFDSIRKAVLTDTPVAIGGDVFGSMAERDEIARAFTRAMHGHSMAAALAWPDRIDLSRHRVMLDVGGGSGAHSIGAVRRWPELSAVVLDMPPVCEVAREFVVAHRLEGRIRTVSADLWTDPFPAADIHLYADIYHDWPPEKCRLLTEKSFASLPSGGRLVVHEMLLNDDRTGPFPVAGYGVAMLLWTEGQQYSGRELCSMLAEVGFVDVEARPTFGNWGIVTGRRP